ncbi:MAG: ATP-binding protein [Anaerotignum sp.]|nr:ATP-binding protein [Anaerotignum sp.]
MDICAQVEQRKKVLSDWNLQSRYSYGTSVSAIFSGPPGTGKTMAAHVMAGILGLELFKVDLSQIVDKYIGETEKRLEEVFQRAERSNMILFFDEADAIIGKRSETKEAKDKYANTEVAYLLQRMEEYDGIVILATNYSQNIDAAFMRRIRFTVHFPLPDEMTRKEIWQSAFAAETPVGYMDYDYLARQFEFSGGQIKNVVWNACFFAAQENSPVEMQHMVRAIQMELTKDKKVSFAEALGAYASLIY